MIPPSRFDDVSDAVELSDLLLKVTFSTLALSIER